MRVTSKGQVTIPKEVREKLGVKPGDEVGFREEGQGVIVYKADENTLKPNAGLALVKHLQEMGKRVKRAPMTTEELMELTRGPFNDIDSH